MTEHITCRISGDSVLIDLGEDDSLDLTHDQARRLYSQIANVLFVGDGGVGRQIVIADVPLSHEEAFQLSEEIGFAFAESERLQNRPHRINWKKEGF